MGGMASISIGNDEQQSPEAITVRLVGTEYSIRPPKLWAAMRTTQRLQGLTSGEDMSPAAIGEAVDAMEAWLRGAAGGKTADAILERLDDRDDALDLLHVAELIEKVTEATTGDPTT